MTNGTTSKPMMNAITAYQEAGRKAGKASRQRDVSLAGFHSRWMRSAVALEAPENREAARKAFDQAYRDEATPSAMLG